MIPSPRHLLRFACLALAAAPTGAGQLDVPGTHATVQAAIDAAQPGDEIVVHGGTHGPIVVDVAVTLVGDPAPLFVNNGEVGSCGGCYAAPIQLAGPGSGVVTLADVRVGGTIDGFFLPFSDGGIRGGGFDELRIYDSAIEAPSWVNLTGVAEGFPAVDVTVPTVLISESSVRGSDAGNDDCYSSGPDGGDGVRAPGATVVVLDSTVEGGGSDSICSYFGCGFNGGGGGAGVVAAELISAGSSIAGGVGAELLDYSGFPPAPCGQGPDGPDAVAASTTDLGNALGVVAGDLALNASWTLDYTPASQSVAVVLVSTGAQLPPLALLDGPAFLDVLGIVFVQTIPVPGPFGLTLGNNQALIGVELAVQVFELGAGLSRPVIDVVLP